ncbi:MAG: serine--tRNA ligase [Proteobacteria bacterium]|nr:serine--tRNA ligase [Pseudomonadota bacterium]
MFDLKWIRDNSAAFDAGLKARGMGPTAARVIALDEKRREALTAAQEIQARRNKLSKEIGIAKTKGEDVREMIRAVSAEEELQAEAEERVRQLAAGLDELLEGLPNLAADDVPVGEDASANVVLRTVGVRPEFDFTPKEHFEIGAGLDQMDFERAAKMSGARFVVLTGALARLERALAQFMLDLHTTEFGYTEVSPPLLVRDDAVFGTGQLPKFGDDLFRTTDDYWLIPTAEVPLTNLVRERILDEGDLPLRFTAFTGCFRSEAGAAGKDTRGMLRQHQFYKVELVSITHPDHSEAELERMTSCAEEVLKRLGLHYQVVILSTSDIGFAARKTLDIEVWLPGQEAYREISSCSNCWDFQARRMKARFKPAGGKGTRFVHTLNGSGLAVGRTLIALLEHYQRADGSVEMPTALRPYMDGLEVLTADV